MTFYLLGFIIIRERLVIKMWLQNLIKMKRLSKKTLDQISTESGIPKGTLNKLFSGNTKDPQLSTIRAVVHTLGYTLDDLNNDKFSINGNMEKNIETSKTAKLISQICDAAQELSEDELLWFLNVINTYKEQIIKKNI